MENKLDTTNPQYLGFTYEGLSYTLLGGVKIEGLDRLRVTVKAQYKTLAIRHNLDLYNDSQSEKLIRKMAERFELSIVYLQKTMAELINQLEQYRMEELKKQQENIPKPKVLTDTEVRAARAFLSQANLLEKTNDLIGKSGVIGEERNRLLMYLIFTSRKRENPLHIVSLAASGMGKSYLQEKVGELIPEEDKIEVTTLSENAFYYFERRALSHKLILIEDLDGAESVLYPLRELQSKKKIIKTIPHKDSSGVTKTITLTVEGPVSVAGCTTQESIYEDNANRSFLIYLDESAQQDEKIMQRQRALSAGKIDSEAERQIKELLQNTQRLLQPVTVRNPYAELLQLPLEIFKPRRTNSHYLQFIEAVTFYHQYQREQKADETTGEIFIETSLADIESANALLKDVLLRKSDELTKASRNYLELLKAHVKENQCEIFTNGDIRKKHRMNHSNQKRYMLQLLQGGYVKRVEDKTAKTKGYAVVSHEEYTQLQNKITTVLDEVLARIKVQHNNLSGSPQGQSSKEVHLQNGPPEKLKTKPKTTKVQKSSGEAPRPEKISYITT